MSGRKTVILPKELALLRRQLETALGTLEELEDVAAVQVAKRDREKRDHLPSALLDRLMNGEAGLRIWREHRKLGVDELAERAGVTATTIREIESGKRAGAAAAIAALAEVLDVAPEDIAPARKRPRRRAA